MMSAILPIHHFDHGFIDLFIDLFIDFFSIVLETKNRFGSLVTLGTKNCFDSPYSRISLLESVFTDAALVLLPIHAMIS
jgi:hypothetical protein